jgi:two-component system, chemotaxis family, protein-glutamate methylesterase/glutaminase
VDVLFRSVAEVYGAHVLAVVMTGMGQDGLRGCQQIQAAGGQILVQDEASSVVWGMPGFVARAGIADQVVPLSRMADEIVARVLRQRRSVRAAI